MITRKERLAQKIAEVVKKRDYYGRILDTANFQMLSDDLMQMSSIPSVHSAAIRQSLLEFLNRRADDQILESAARKIVYGTPLLLLDELITEAAAEPGDRLELALLDAIIVIRPRVYVNMPFIVQSGSLAGYEDTLQLRPSDVQRLGRKIGAGKRPFRQHHPRDLVGMHLNCTLDHQMALVGFTADKTVYARNANLQRRRRCAEEKKCQKSCLYCPTTTKECPLATHAESWVIGTCSSCGSVYVDTRGRCLYCLEQAYKQTAGILEFGEKQ